MPRPAKIEISAINIRIPSDKNRNYIELLQYIYELKRGVKIFGHTYLAINSFDPKTLTGTISRYDEIDVDEDWFNVEDFTTATAEEVEKISIPEKLRPNHSSFYFYLDENLHTIFFEVYASSKSISAKSVNTYFRNILDIPDIYSRFGKVECDTIKSFEEVERILSLNNLKELKITIKRPNSDDMDDDLASEIERRLNEQNSNKMVHMLFSDTNALNPNQHTTALAQVAAQNGDIEAKNLENGIVTTHSTKENPMKMIHTYNSEDESSISVFHAVVQRMAGQISSWRRTPSFPQTS